MCVCELGGGGGGGVERAKDMVMRGTGESESLKHG